MALSEAVKEGLWIMGFIDDLDVGIHFDTIPFTSITSLLLLSIEPSR